MRTIIEVRTNGKSLNYDCLYHKIGLAVASSTKNITSKEEKEIIESVYDAVQEWLSEKLKTKVSEHY